MELTENVIGWYTGENHVLVTLSQKKFITKVRRLAENFPDEVEIVYVNKDGSVLCKLPLRAIKINLSAKRELTDEQKNDLAIRLKKARESGMEVDEEDILETM